MTSNVDLRQRKLIHSDNETVRSHSQRRRQGRSTSHNLKFSFACLIASVTLLVLFFVIYFETGTFDHIASQLGYNEKKYAIVLDAGSTGSRILAYEFHVGYVDGQLVLDRELFREIKPGLSSYVDQPVIGAERIIELLDIACEFVPNAEHAKTPIVLKATAGLRLLPQAKADQLLDEVRRVLKTSGFLVNDDSVEIMDGTDEGIFSWFTVNFLLGALGSPNSVAALDLGGGSTQVTFVPRDPRKTPSHTEYMHSVPSVVGSEAISVFTHSYLGLGLMAVRYAVFSHDHSKNERNLTSICVNPVVQGKKWTYSNIEYSVSGHMNAKSSVKDPEVDFNQCKQAIRQYVLSLLDPKPISLMQSQIAAFSYYFERAVETGIIDLEGGDISIEDISRKAQEVCAIPNTDQPFMCLDITYISVLLQEGFGLPAQTNLKLYKKINGHEISWALGCAYNLLRNLS